MKQNSKIVPFDLRKNANTHICLSKRFISHQFVANALTSWRNRARRRCTLTWAVFLLDLFLHDALTSAMHWTLLHYPDTFLGELDVWGVCEQTNVPWSHLMVVEITSDHNTDKDSCSWSHNSQTKEWIWKSGDFDSGPFVSNFGNFNQFLS